MDFGTIGAGTVAQAIAGHLVAAGHRVVLSNSRGPATLGDVVARLGPLATGGSEFVAEHAPGASVVKGFNTLYAKYIAADPRHTEGRQLLFYAGDDVAAKAAFHAVADGLGFAPVDAGALREGGRLMQVGGGPLSAVHALKQD